MTLQRTTLNFIPSPPESFSETTPLPQRRAFQKRLPSPAKERGRGRGQPPILMSHSDTTLHSADREKARKALSRVIDPELFVNVIDLGLVYELTFTPDNGIHVLMTLSTPHCPMGEAITNGVRNVLEAAFPGRGVRIDLTFDPAWSFEMLSEEGKRQLGM